MYHRNTMNQKGVVRLKVTLTVLAVITNSDLQTTAYACLKMDTHVCLEQCMSAAGTVTGTSSKCPMVVTDRGNPSHTIHIVT